MLGFFYVMELNQLHKLFLESSVISTDTRKIVPDSIFFALKGANFNGNLFAKDALDKGAKFAVVDEKEFALDSNYILVDDVLNCLQELASFHRNQLSCPVLGITGTNGKTTTKELINAVLERKYSVVCTKGNLNNHIGVPLTLLSAKLDTEFLIVEMGANHQNEIKLLSEIANINYGIITNIGKAHLEGFGSVEGVTKTKKELYDYIKTQKGTIFINKDDELLQRISSNINKVEYSTQENENGSPFASVTHSGEDISSKLIGSYNCTNIQAAISIGNYFGVTFKEIKAAIEHYTPHNNRSQLEKTSKGNSLIIDYYNANPTSMIKAMQSFYSVKSDKKLFILGDMLELGDTSINEHQKIIDKLNKEQSEAILIGTEFGKCKHTFPQFKDVNEAKKWLQQKTYSDYFILLKGSRGIKLEEIKCLL